VTIVGAICVLLVADTWFVVLISASVALLVFIVAIVEIVADVLVGASRTVVVVGIIVVEVGVFIVVEVRPLVAFVVVLIEGKVVPEDTCAIRIAVPSTIMQPDSSGELHAPLAGKVVETTQ
jgi:membrane-bound ClpP family serine protease